MKTVIHKNKVYQVTDWNFDSLVEAKEKLSKNPNDECSKQFYNDLKAEIFKSNDYLKADIVL